MEAYKLYATHYFSAPGLAFDTALKMIGVELELFTEINIHLFIENSIRGGMSMMSHRYASANQPGVRSYDPQRDVVPLIYLDANNLHGYAMS